MAFSTSDGRTHSSLADINITPLVDVMLVLLVIFMITAPVIQSGIEVSVPHTRNVRVLTTERVVVTVDRSGNVYEGDQLVNIHNLAATLRQKLPDPSRQEVYVRADEHLPWGQLAQVMDAIKQGGLQKVSLVTQPYDR
ncbi:MAG: ExbD/TolR family protein [Terriglobales bacterium]